MSQAVAILHDSVRELRSRSLFWISLAISVLVAVSLFGIISFEENGWRVLWFDPAESDFIRKGSRGARDLMTYLFSGVYVYFWLSWGAIILAVLSTASILPSFLAGGSIEISLAKPISRLRFFTLKVVGALLFVLLQTALGVGLAYVLLGTKAQMWLHPALWAIPLILVQFFYLYAVSCLVAVITRSTMAALMITVIFWVVLSLIQFSTNQIDSLVVQCETIMAPLQSEIATINERAEQEGREPTPIEQARLARYEGTLKPYADQLRMVQPYQKPLTRAEMLVPKTGDIRKMIAGLTGAPTLNDLMAGSGALDNPAFRPANVSEEEWDQMQEAGLAGKRAALAVDWKKSIGSSLAFSFVVFGVAAFLFVRRDF